VPRPREFDERQAVDAAMNAFWAEGYETTSTRNLCDATGLGRSSIYNTFTSKHELFRRSLEHYHDTATRCQSEMLRGEGSTRDKIRTLLSAVVDDEPAAQHGCLAVNTTVEFGCRDTEISILLRKGYDQLLDSLQEAIEAGQQAGEITVDRDARVLAQFVHGTLGGLCVLARGGTDRDALRSVIDVAMGAF